VAGRDDEFVAFYAARADHLRRTAYLLCGDWHLAQDLTQVAVTKVYQAWHRIDRHDTLDQYARRVLLRAFLDERRRPWRREYATTPWDEVLDRVAPQTGRTDDRLVLRTALLRIPKGRRAVLVLRFWADLSVEQVAGILDCSAASTSAVAPPPVPTWQQSQAHGQRLADLLVAALPPGVVATVEFTSPSGRTAIWMKQPDNGQYVSVTGIAVSTGGGQGQLEAFTLRDDAPAPTGDLCAAASSARFDAFFGAGDSCRTVTVGGVPVRVSTRTGPDLGQVVIAVRVLDGGYAGVEESTGRWSYRDAGTLPPDARYTPIPGGPAPAKLAAPPLTGDRLAALAADPDLLP
jgi:RNA polymerase sigma factor (sigma-70 family)